MRRSRVTPSEKMIFVHIPKTAGSSFRELLQEIYPRKRCVLIYSHEPDHLDALRKEVERADAICGHVSFGIHEFYGIEARYVTFVRHPVDRVISLYRHQAREPGSEYHQLIARDMTLKDLLRSEQYPQFNNHMVRIIAGLPDSEPAHDRHLLERAEANLDLHFDFVGLTERFDESVALLGKTLGWTALPSIPRLNVDPDWGSVTVDEETRTEIVRFNALDLALYDSVVSEQHLYATLPLASPTQGS